MQALYTCFNVIMLVGIEILCWLWPNLASPTLAFGVRIPPTRLGEPVIAQLRRRYRVALLLAGLIELLALLLVARLLPLEWQLWLMPLVVIAAVVIAGCLYALMHRTLRRVKEREGWYSGLRQAIAVEVGLPERQARPSPVWLGLDLLLLGLLWGLTVVRYPALPERIPLHFGPNGQVDRWGGKEELLLFSLFALVINVLLLGLALTLPVRSRRLDPADPEQARLDRQRQQQALRNLLAAVLGAVNLSFFLILLLLTQVIPPTAFGIVFVGVLLLPLAILGLMIFYLAQARPAHTYVVRTSYVERDDDRYWKAGIFYVNRDDPALFVERRMGVGWTVNMGQPLGVGLVIGLLLAVVAILLVLLLLGQH
ncbi:DUF1648 domain-containing protein [Thermogemmatispora sp.]|uniref:DUF1648 domain-containing protein n=1 Tax=Thermogemmatispora sp. TaxID=1968838 RepID=UPI001DD7925B|nr:DUF1648 domain-containing protein [Thermogemmatispora sp.]MBX5452035.1 DUF1648 domain-containing protein [Thermogemmatispora sp.]